MKIQPPQVIARELAYPRRDLWVLIGVNLLVRLILTPLNAGEYTDGILQVQQFQEPVGIWPPLYTTLVYPLHFIIGYLWAGRLVSAVASALAVWPIYRLTQRAFGTRAALYAGIFYTVAPISLRWAPRVMTDATFSLFFYWAIERLAFASDEREVWSARRALSFGTMHAVLACLVRYQGLLLLGPIIVVTWIVWRRFKHFPLKPLVWLLGLLIIPLWVYLNGFIHGDQFAERAFGQKLATWRVLLLNGEAFVAYTPYFLTYPVMIWATVGMFWSRMRRGPFFGWTCLYVFFVLLFAQSAFSSFQSRYFLPLYGFFWALAGAGMWAVQERWRKHHRTIKQRLFPYLMIGTFAFSGGFALLMLAGQREAFGDIVAASRFAGETAGPDTLILTNELYREGQSGSIAADKVAFFAKRPASYLGPYVPNRTVQSDAFGARYQEPAKRIPDGSILVLSSAYGASYYEDYLSSQYELVPLHEPFQSTLMPFLPDIMSQPGTAQNPAAWLFRYDWQKFYTTVYRVEGPR
ncbi:glycosyltransferase family 39 protein [bacterium]|nr:glycosyltransferase family 39 protein [bacterium]